MLLSTTKSLQRLQLQHPLTRDTLIFLGVLACLFALGAIVFGHISIRSGGREYGPWSVGRTRILTPLRVVPSRRRLREIRATPLAHVLPSVRIGPAILAYVGISRQSQEGIGERALQHSSKASV